jgi:hypothetical protein
MLNFAEQTGSGAVIVVWSFLKGQTTSINNNKLVLFFHLFATAWRLHRLSLFLSLSYVLVL